MGFGRQEPARIEAVPGQSSGQTCLGPEPRGRVADPNARDHKVGRDFGQRDQNEGAVEQFGMGQGQPFGLKRNAVVGDEVDVDDPRTPSLRRLAAELDLQPFDAVRAAPPA